VQLLPRNVRRLREHRGVERLINFSRNRYMLCGLCSHHWIVDLDWIDRWDQALELCPGCGVTCEVEDAPKATVDPGDLALSDDNVAQFAWYHTSTQPDWPTRGFDPAAKLTELTRERMGGDERVARWAERQKAKALHVGTYEAAVHNMLRRIDDQADHGAQFYLYRVHLAATITVREGWLVDPSNWVGDVVLDEVCPPGVDVARYLNHHEDPGGLSLALGQNAITSTQQIAIPSPTSDGSSWVATAVDELERANRALPPSPGSRRTGIRRAPTSKSIRASELATPLAEQLPVNLRRQFEAATAFNDDQEPESWARYVIGLMNLVLAPAQVVAELDEQPVRYL
jgi:hypothetical protein